MSRDTGVSTCPASHIGNRIKSNNSITSEKCFLIDL